MSIKINNKPATEQEFLDFVMKRHPETSHANIRNKYLVTPTWTGVDEGKGTGNVGFYFWKNEVVEIRYPI